jgi:glycosyltransferase involved in cell wall biosynthesis
MNLYIVATNIHTGGGKTLLEALVSSLDHSQPTVLLVDSRLTLKLPSYLRIFKIKPSLKERIRSEWLLRQMVQPEDRVICLGNLPPLFKLKAPVGVYLQNRYLVENRSAADFKPFTRFRILIERIWLRLCRKNVKHFIVQTPSMQRQIQTNLGRAAVQLPFHSEVAGYERTLPDGVRQAQKRWDFIYVASGDPHKNHERLVNTWVALAAEGLRPSLCLTIDTKKFPELCCWIETMTAEHNLNISNAGHQPYQAILGLYPKAKALIYPSLFETIGLPLIEARCAGLAVLAAELDYVRDVVDPEVSFDPQSVVSIARAVKRFMGIPEEKLSLQSPGSFISSVLKVLAE